MTEEILILAALIAAFLLIGGLLGAWFFRRKRSPVVTERRSFSADQEKFATQRTVTYILLGVFIGVTATVLYQNDQSERSMILQTVINLTLLAVGYWVGASKGAADSTGTLGKIAENAAPSQALAVAAARSDPVVPSPGAPIQAENVNVEATGEVTVNQEKPK